MDEFGTTADGETEPVPDALRSLFNHPDDVRVQHLPCILPGLDSLAVHFAAGARTVPHRHHGDFDLDAEQRDWADTYDPEPGR